MKPELSEHLIEYNRSAKQFSHAEVPKEKLDGMLESLRDFYAGEIAPQRDSTPEAQKRILNIQETKRQIMDQLRADILELDKVDYVPENKKGLDQAVYENGKFSIQQKDGLNTEASLGEIITDSEWNRQYFLDPQTVPRNISKRYLIEQAKRKLRDFYDKQIIIDETTSTKTHRYKKEAYKRIASEAEEGVERMGIIAEKMVRLFLEKLTYDHPDLEFNVIHADVYDDVEKKIDFVIHIKQRYRGVRVEADAQAGDKGIQFTVNDAPENIKRKKSQLVSVKENLQPSDRIKDIVLVSLPMGNFFGAYQTWKEQRKPVGGPDKLWGARTKEMIFCNVMKKVLRPEEIDKQWKIISESQPVEEVTETGAVAA